MPISADLNPRNFITKLTKYEYLVNIPNSVTILDDFLPLFGEMMEKKLTGTYNCTNRGTISHNQCMNLYKKYIDSSFTYKNFTKEEQSKILKAGRSDNCLDTTKIRKVFPDIPDIHTSIVHTFERMKGNLKKE